MNTTQNHIALIDAPCQNLTFEQLRIYYDVQGKRLDDDTFAMELGFMADRGKYNHIAYMLADKNDVSIKVAKYSTIDRCHLIENIEFGCCSLITATKNIIDKINIENNVAVRIGYPERIEVAKWNKKALNAAIISSIILNDYTLDNYPKFAIFPDRLEISFVGSINDDASTNNELIRIYQELKLIESVGDNLALIRSVFDERNFVREKNTTHIILPISKHYYEIMGIL